MLGTIHLILVSAFVAVTALLLGLTVTQRLRIRRVRMSWISARAKNVPVWPIVFIGVVAIFLVYAQNSFPSVEIPIYAGYLVGGVLWFVSALLASSSLVTDYGIIPELGRSGDAIAWGQIVDYFEVLDGKQFHFVFIYQDLLAERRRLEVTVPIVEVERFRMFLRSHLDSRMEIPEKHAVGRKALEK